MKNSDVSGFSIIVIVLFTLIVFMDRGLFDDSLAFSVKGVLAHGTAVRDYFDQTIVLIIYEISLSVARGVAVIVILVIADMAVADGHEVVRLIAVGVLFAVCLGKTVAIGVIGPGKAFLGAFGGCYAIKRVVGVGSIIFEFVRVLIEMMLPTGS